MAHVTFQSSMVKEEDGSTSSLLPLGGVQLKEAVAVVGVVIMRSWGWLGDGDGGVMMMRIWVVFWVGVVADRSWWFGSSGLEIGWGKLVGMVVLFLGRKMEG